MRGRLPERKPAQHVHSLSAVTEAVEYRRAISAALGYSPCACSLGMRGLDQSVVDTRGLSWCLSPADALGATLRRLGAVGEVEGLWELVFSTQLPSGYMPVREVIGFYPSRDQITIDTTVGPLPLGG